MAAGHVTSLFRAFWKETARHRAPSAALHKVEVDDMRAVLAAGASRAQIEDGLAVCFAFNTINRFADAFGFVVPGPKAFETGAKFLLTRGYN